MRMGVCEEETSMQMKIMLLAETESCLVDLHFAGSRLAVRDEDASLGG